MKLITQLYLVTELRISGAKHLPSWRAQRKLTYPSSGACECGNEPFGSIKYGVFLGWLLNW